MLLGLLMACVLILRRRALHGIVFLFPLPQDFWPLHPTSSSHSEYSHNGPIDFFFFFAFSHLHIKLTFGFLWNRGYEVHLNSLFALLIKVKGQSVKAESNMATSQISSYSKQYSKRLKFVTPDTRSQQCRWPENCFQSNLGFYYTSAVPHWCRDSCKRRPNQVLSS